MKVNSISYSHSTIILLILGSEIYTCIYLIHIYYIEYTIYYICSLYIVCTYFLKIYLTSK